MENKVGEKRPRSPSLEGDVDEGGVPDPNPASVNVNPADQEDHGGHPNANMLNNIAANANQIGALLGAWVGQQHPLNPEILNQLATNATPEVRAVIQALLVPGHDHDHDQVAAAGQEQAPPLNPHILNQIAAANANPELRAVIQALVPGVVGPLPPLQGEDHQPKEEEEEAVVGHEHEIAAGQEIADHQQHGLHQGEHDVGAGDIGQGAADHQECGLQQGDVVGAGDDIVQEEDAAIGETQAQRNSEDTKSNQ